VSEGREMEGRVILVLMTEGGKRMTTWNEGRSIGLIIYALVTLPSVAWGV